MRRLIAFLLCLLLGCSIGCLSTGDIADYAFVLSFGIERGDTFAYRAVFLVALPNAGSEEGATLETEVCAAEARTLFEAIETLNAAMPLRLRFSRTSLILLSETLLRDGEIQTLLDFSLGALDIHSNVRVMAARGALRELYDGLVSDADPSFSKTMETVDALASHSGTMIDARCRAVWESLGSQPFDLVLPLVGVGEPDPLPDALGSEPYPKQGGALAQNGGNDASIIGCAVFDGTRMVGTLSGWHTQLLGMVRGDFSEGEMTLYHPTCGTVSVRLKTRKKPRVKLQGDAADVLICLDLTPLYPLSVREDGDALSAWVEAELERTLAALFEWLQASNADAMGFGRYDAMNHPFAATEDWKDRYPALSASFAVEVRALRPGGAS